MNKSFKSKAINAVISAIVRTLLGWAEEWDKDAFFFLVIGDKTCTDVAWHNSNNLSSYGATAIANFPEAAGTFSNVNTGVELLMEEPMKDKKYRDIFEKSGMGDDKPAWFSFEELDTDEQKQA